MGRGGQALEEGASAESGAAEDLAQNCLLCFTAETLVQMADGTNRRIRDVQVGDLVKSRDPLTGKESAKTVTATIKRLAPAVVTVALVEAKTGQTETLTCTPEHPLYVQGQGWVEAGSLGIGTSIVSRAGPLLTVQSVTWQRETAQASDPSSLANKPYTVYNLTVEDDHTYFVGSLGGGTWVHNAFGCTRIYRGTLNKDPNIPQVSQSMRGVPSEDVPSGAENFLTNDEALAHSTGYNPDAVSATTDLFTASKIYGPNYATYDVPNSVFSRLPQMNPLQGEVTFKYSIPEAFRVP